MKMRILLLTGYLATMAMGANFEGQGYFQAMSSTVPTYVKIQGDSGFYCILDDKSSFRFKIIGDSMTTPMNGIDGIAYAPGSGSLRVWGEEKGAPYSTTFAPRSPSQYPAACVEEEEKLYGPNTTGLIQTGPRNRIAGSGREIDLLGRKRETTARPVRTWTLRRSGP